MSSAMMGFHMRLGLAIVLLAACTPAPDAGVESATAIRDSSGVTIVENQRPYSDLPEWTLSPEPILELGSMDSSEEFNLLWVNSAFHMDNGRLVVTNSGSQQLLFFDASGEFLHSVGGKGEGPGEYSMPRRTWRIRGDSLAVWDAQRRRISVLDSEGEFGRSILPSAPGFDANMSGAQGGWSDGMSLITHITPVMSETDFETSYADLLAFSVEGELTDTLATIAFWEYKLIGQRAVMRLFAPSPQLVVTGSGFWLGDSREYEVRFIDRSGSVRRIVRWDGPDRTIHEHQIESYWEDALEEAASTSDTQLGRVREMQEIQPVADRFPTYAWFRVDTDDNLWVLNYPQPGVDDPRHLWTIFTPDGSILALLRTPADVKRVFEIGPDYLIALARNELDVEFLRVYRLNRNEQHARSQTGPDA